MMSLFASALARVIAISTIAILSATTSATAQMAGQAQESASHEGGGMMSGGSGWGMGHGNYGMGGFGGIGILVLALVVIAIAVLAFRRRQP